MADNKRFDATLLAHVFHGSLLGAERAGNRLRPAEVPAAPRAPGFAPEFEMELVPHPRAENPRAQLLSTRSDQIKTLGGLCKPYLLVVGAACALLIKQPDLADFCHDPRFKQEIADKGGQ